VRLGQWLALLGASVAIGVVIALVVSWPDTGGRTLSISQTPPTSPKEAASSAAAAPHVRVRTCDPIFGGGAPHGVSTFAARAAPASCDAAHAVLLAALNRGSASVGDWHCVSRPNQRTLEACTSSGGRRIAARD
jgi:hypothetical protein